MSKKTNFKIEVQRDKILQKYSQGYSQSEISKILSLGIGTVHRYISEFRYQAAENMSSFIDKKFPEEFAKCSIALNEIQKQASIIIEQAPDTS
jgi:transposase